MAGEPLREMASQRSLCQIKGMLLKSTKTEFVPEISSKWLDCLCHVPSFRMLIMYATLPDTLHGHKDIFPSFGYERGLLGDIQSTSPTENLANHKQMANHLPALIDPWLEAFVATDWLSFRTHGLAAVRFLRNIQLQPAILQSAVRFWDPDVHVFRFGDDELCPTVEELQGYLQSFASHLIVIPPYRKSMSKLLKTSLDITTGAAESLLSGGQINIMRLMEWYGPEGDTGDMAWQARRHFALVISVLAAYLLVSPTGQVNPSLVSVATQLGGRRNVVPMVLAETLIGLDLVASGQTMIFGGSPLLSQLWLSDKLGLIAAPVANWPRLPGQMHQREMLYPEMPTAEWVRFMNELPSEEITWRHEELGILDMAVKSAGYERVVIAGLSSHSTFLAISFGSSG
ncbi:hypothetical protein RHMOL_Rhmol02G0184200 [Rhododendron molle]|uniref:Uncharacterized protein n=1 Tax=Rhododendron molle TaxID=49168 RepID=A0ACC0PSY5_RHOML|nr:hypothetical protein RHMOL_Rhmol02G0184200 [Rhododendron molle]